jgi:hypothetical protein
VDAIMRQRESAAAENAIKLTVFQTDEAVVVPTGTVITGQAAMDEEPKLRGANKKTEAAPSGDVSDVVKKWAKK